MPLSTTAKVREAFAEASRQSLARSLQTGDDWDRFKTIVHETDERIKAEQSAHAADFRARVAEAKEIILREEHGIRLDRPLPPGAEKFSDKHTLQTKAEIRVSQDFDRRIAAIKTDELDQYRALTAEIRARSKPDQTQAQTRDQAQERTHSVSPIRSGPSHT